MNPELYAQVSELYHNPDILGNTITYQEVKIIVFECNFAPALLSLNYSSNSDILQIEIEVICLRIFYFSLQTSQCYVNICEVS